MKIKRLITEPARHAAMLALRPIERSLLYESAPVPVPVFVVGAPRSGTSLLYELLVTHARFAYISNLAHRLYLTPAAATRLGRRRLNRWSGTLSSAYGHIGGWGAPNEGGWVWRRWTPEDGELGPEHAETFCADEMVRTVAAIARVMNAPFLNKNVMHGAHIRLLASLFPGAVFVHITRDTADNARSIYRARQDTGDTAEWISVRPRGWEEHAHRHPAAQVVAQVELINQMISDDTCSAGTPRVVLTYEDLCAAPEETVSRVVRELGQHGVATERRCAAPESLSRSVSRALGDDAEHELQSALGAWASNSPRMKANAG